ncbi:MAG: hypothetical protein ACRD2L_08710, partial [Terriglobia bacterium]
MGSLRIRELEDAIRAGHGSGEPKLKTALTRLSFELEQRLERGIADSQSYFTRAAAALTSIRGPGNSQLRLSCFFQLSHFFHLAGLPRDVLSMGTRMLALAELVGNAHEKRRALLMLGVGLVEQGHVARGIECYARALSIAREMSDAKAEAALWVNTSVALQVSSQFEESIHCSRRALDVAATDPAMRFHRSAAFSNIAYSCLRLNRIAEGIRAAESSMLESPSPRTASDFSSLVTREQNFALLLIEAKQYALARQCVLRASDYAARSGSPHAQVSVLVVSGLCNVSSGNVDSGLRELEEACERSTSTIAIHIDALISLVKAYDLLDRPDEALLRLKRLCELVGLTRSDSISLDGQMATLDMQLVAHLERASDHDLSELKYREATLRAKLAEKRLEVASFEMLERLAITADLREEASGEHGYRVGKMSSLLAEQLGWGFDAYQQIELTARLHDIG